VFHHILIPTDLSGRSAEAVEMARDLAKESGVRITLSHSISLVVASMVPPAHCGTKHLASHRIDLSRPGYGWSTLSYKIGVLAPCPVRLVK
jgi:nucleotide-binding universal stress UspA family protein